MVGGNFVGGIGPLSVTGSGEYEYAEGDEPAMLDELFHWKCLSWVFYPELDGGGKLR
jgi:hypothetical protein